jgi:hypothetical protein
MKIFLAVLMMLFLIAFLSNPTADDHRNSVRSVVREKVKNLMTEHVKPKKAWQRVSLAIGYGLSMDWVDDKINTAISADDYIFCSVTNLRVKNKNIMVGVGAFGDVWLITDTLEEIDYKALVE